MILFEVATPDGTWRRCDAGCHEATGPARACTCVCGGRFHGKLAEAAALYGDPERLNEEREKLRLQGGEHVQLRIGA